MLHLFFSYSRHDSAFVYDVAKRVEESVGHVWIDKEDIPSSVPWRDEIEAAIESAALVVIFDSPAWRRSEICLSEAEIAQNSAKTLLIVPTDMPVAEVCQQITDAQANLTIGDLRNAEVLTRTRAWNQSGRKRNLLASSMQLRDLRKALRGRSVPLSEPVTAFLSASRRLAIVRGILSSMAILATVALFSSFRVLEGVNERVTTEITTKAENHASENHMELLAAYAPVELLEMLAKDDPKTISAELRLLQLTSQKWPIERWGPNGTLPSGAQTAKGTLGTAAIVEDGTVTIYDEKGVLQRALTHGPPAISLAWSPHGTLLAVARSQHVEVINPTTGLTVTTLRFSLPDVVAVVWESTSGKLAVLTSKGAGMRWDLASLGESVLGDDAWALSGAGFPGSDSMLVSLRDRLTVLDGTGFVTASRTSEDFYIDVTATDTLGVMAAFRIRDGEPPHLVLIDGEAAETEAFALSDDCIAGGIAVTPARFVVGCGDGLFNVIERASGEVRSVRNSISAIATTAMGEVILARDRGGVTARLSPELDTAEILPGTICPAESALMVAVPQHRVAFVAGPGTAGTCTLAQIHPESGTTHNLIFPDVAAPRSQALAVSDDGRFVAHGFDDGTIWVRQVSGNGESPSILINRDLADQVRALAFTPGGSAVTGVSRDGRFVRIPLPNDPLVHARKQAADIVDNMIKLGIYAPDES